MQSAVKRKYPATPRMLEWLYSYLKHDAGLDKADAAAVWAAVNVGFFYLLRASEFLVGAQPWSWDGVLHGRDIIGRKDGAKE